MVPRLALALLVILAGCAGFSGDPSEMTTTGEPSATPSTTSSRDTPTETTATERNTVPTRTKPPESRIDMVSEGTACNEHLAVGIYGPLASMWEPDAVRVGYQIPANTSMLLATYIDGSLRGADYVNNSEDGMLHADGAKLVLNTTLSGEHVVEVVVYDDENENERLDRGIDKPCLRQGEFLQAGPKRIDFSRFD